jgi:predicted metallopeptidase
MVSISVDRVTVIIHHGASERAQAFIYGGADAMQRAMQRHQDEEVRAILMVADRRNA